MYAECDWTGKQCDHEFAVTFAKPGSQQNTSGTSKNTPSGTNKPIHGKSRYAQGHRGKRSAKPQAPKAGPVNEYLSKCCSLPARKPVAGERAGGINPETKKASKVIKGLGHWRCSGCGKSTEVSLRKPQPATLGTVIVNTEVPQEVPSA